MNSPHAALWWLPVGAGGHFVIHTSHWWEAMAARREKRPSQPLYHAALEIFTGTTRYVIEMGPAWGQTVTGRGVVATGPVGMEFLGRWRLFRYEVRCWEDGVIPDRDFAVGEVLEIPLTAREAGDMIARTTTVPPLTWGRDEFGIGDMWNSNSLVAWLLHTGGVEAADFVPPSPGRAPGWQAGIIAAEQG
ncbi:hypothetical protein COCCU_14360 (plasmid) [Corynebacterium occultum]|uniref:Uncharacterized protein n=1 Tax=Corynebacterium occultum TaxID=2675219 RepID=A0A6B8VT58_9CORY|nr:hypothetical protein [Corynebacterium occultum]QGU08762.1 hypothetical protein COCCU_14360 [Corynebacterium occultum]